MPRSRIALWALALAYPCVSFADQNAAIDNYIKPIIASIANDPNVGGWTWETHGNGGYLLRMEMDVNGDGHDEIFLTSSLTAVKRSADWRVFHVDTSGAMRPYARSIEVPADSVWPSSDEAAPSLIYVAAPSLEREQANEAATFPVYRFTFAFPEIDNSLSYATEEAVAALRPPDANRLPKLKAILLADYLADTNAGWSEVEEWKMDANDSFFRPEDRDRAASNTFFTPEVALNAINQRQQTNRTLSPAAPSPPTPASPAGVKDSTPQPKTSPTRATVETESSSDFPIMPAAIVGAMILGIVLYLLRRKST